jgi:cobalt-zinc-cadmium efflux system protein
MVRDVLRVRGVLGIHDLHVWSLAKDLRTMSAHVLTDDVPMSAGNRIHNEIRALLAERYGIAHSTLQLESVSCDSTGLYCRIQASAHTRHQ